MMGFRERVIQQRALLQLSFIHWVFAGNDLGGFTASASNNVDFESQPGGAADGKNCVSFR